MWTGACGAMGYFGHGGCGLLNCGLLNCGLDSAVLCRAVVWLNFLHICRRGPDDTRVLLGSAGF